MKLRSILAAATFIGFMAAASAGAQTYPSPTYSSVTLSNGAASSEFQTALPTAFPPWQAVPGGNLYLGRTQAAQPGDSDYGQTYLGMPYGPELNGFELDGQVERILSTTYGWSAAGGDDNLFVVNQADPGTGQSRMRGLQNYNNYSSRLSYGQGDSHAVYFGNRGRSVQLTLTGLTAANFTTDSGVTDPTTGNPIYRISFSASNSGGTLPSAATMAALVPGDMVFTSNGYFALIVKADPNGTWIDVDNWTRGSANVSRDGNCVNRGPSVQPSASQDCVKDIEPGGATSLTAYVGTETTLEPLQLSVALYPTSTNPLTSAAGGIEFTLLNDSYTMPTFNDANPSLDYPLLNAEGGAVQAENSGTVAGSDGVGVWGNGTSWGGPIRRSFVVSTTNAAGPYPMQPLCGFCVTQGSTVKNGYENDQTQTTGYALLSDTGFGGPITASIDKLGDEVLAGNLSVTGTTTLGSLFISPQNIGGQSPSSFSSSQIEFGFNYSGGQGEDDLFLPQRASLPGGLNVYPVTGSGVANAASSPILKLTSQGILSTPVFMVAPGGFDIPPHVVVPTSGTTVTLPSIGGDTILNAAGTLATLTVTLPSPNNDGAFVRIVSETAITSLAVTGAEAITGAPTSMAAGTSFVMEFSSAIGKWIRVDKSA